MNFAEVRFWVLLVGGFTLIWLLRYVVRACAPKCLSNFERAALATLGLCLLLAVGKLTFFVFICVAFGTYAAVRMLAGSDRKTRRRMLWLLIPLQVAPICYYKYLHFFCRDVLQISSPTLHELVIPVGISFYTFQKVAFLVDTLLLEKPVPAFIDYLNFVSFFPQIVAGPIERRDDLLPQMQSFRLHWDIGHIEQGASWVALGLFFKRCLADNLALYFSASSTTNPYLIWTANILFGLRIYFDFAGYSLIALGLARILGVQLTLNFASPYCSTSIAEFWRRWHISLSQWFRDYIYYPLGGGRTHLWALNILIVFLVSGLWHGAGWNFVLWGALHGAFLILNRTAGKRLQAPAPVAWFITMFATFFAWLCFYETRTGVLLVKIQTLLRPRAYGASALYEALHQSAAADGFVMASFVAIASAVLILEWLSIRQRNELYFYLRQPQAAFVLVIAAVLLAPGANNTFVYFAF